MSQSDIVCPRGVGDQEAFNRGVALGRQQAGPCENCTGLDSVLSATDLLRALQRGLEEEAEPLRALIADEDSDCLQRDLRAARLEGLDHALRLLRVAERWEW